MTLNFNEIHLARQLAMSLVIPIFIVDYEGSLLFYNEPAEAILGKRYEETGEMPASVWSRLFTPTDESGTPIPPEDIPLMATLSNRRPAHSRLWIRGLDDIPRHIEVTSFPLLGQSDRFLGAVAMFWDIREE
jgi:PAS domain-containing protein